MEKIWIEIPKLLFFQEGPGVRNHQYTTEGVKLLNVANLVDGRVDLTTSDRYISEEEAYGKYSHFLVEDGDFIIASSGIKVDYFEKKMGFVDKTQLPLCMNTSTIRFKTLDEKKLDIKYFMYYLKSMSFKHQLSRQITGSAQLNFGPSHLKLMKVPVVNIEIQRDIIAKLEKLEKIISARSKQLEEYDTLIKSRFVEIFGDIIVNSKKWPIYEMSEISSSRLGKMLDKKQQTGLYRHPYLANYNVQWFEFVLDDLNEMDFNPKDQIEFELCEGDLLVTEGGEVGRCAVWKGQLDKCYFQKALHRVRCNLDLIVPEYLARVLKVKADYNKFEDIVGSKSTIPHLTGVKLKKIPVPVPPIDKQNEFKEFLEQVDKLKVEVQKSLDKTQVLFESLMQEYFE